MSASMGSGFVLFLRGGRGFFGFPFDAAAFFRFPSFAGHSMFRHRTHGGRPRMITLITGRPHALHGSLSGMISPRWGSGYVLSQLGYAVQPTNRLPRIECRIESSPSPHLSHRPMRFFSRTVGQSDATQNVVERPRSVCRIMGAPHSGHVSSALSTVPVWGSGCVFRHSGYRVHPRKRDPRLERMTFKVPSLHTLQGPM